MNPMLNNIRIVLVGTTHPGNIGAAARAMKTMSIPNLYLVTPKEFPSAEASARAAGADDILANTLIFKDLKSAIADCELVIATSARLRNLPWPMVMPAEIPERVAASGNRKTAIIFGRENSGLTNEEMELANLFLKIPSNDDYSSLNLASAVQIICYELFVSNIEHSNLTSTENTTLVDQGRMEGFYNQLEECMIEVGYHDANNPGRLMHRMRRLFNRAQIDESEYNILRGFLSRVKNNT